MLSSWKKVSHDMYLGNNTSGKLNYFGTRHDQKHQKLSLLLVVCWQLKIVIFKLATVKSFQGIITRSFRGKGNFCN